jgi:hypothetical protein
VRNANKGYVHDHGYSGGRTMNELLLNPFVLYLIQQGMTPKEVETSYGTITVMTE